MKRSTQDDYYRSTEGDDFFDRCKPDVIPPLRDNKTSVLRFVLDSRVEFKSVLEYGCQYGDLMNHFRTKMGVERCVGVEASAKAIAFGKELYGDRIEWYHGTIADNSLNAAEDQGPFDLVIVEDVFGWISRETLFASIANIDDMLGEGGYLFIRDFLPGFRTRNANHHVKNAKIYNHKVPGSHTLIFQQSGMYEIWNQRVFWELDDRWVREGRVTREKMFDPRWQDVLLRKSFSDYFR